MHQSRYHHRGTALVSAALILAIIAICIQAARVSGVL